MKATAGEVYTVYNQYLKRYTACQVAYIAPPDTVSKESWAVILSLDWVGDAPLTAEELPHLRPLYKDFMYWSRDLHLLRVPLEVPPQYKLVGTLPPFTDQPCRSYGGWSDGYDVYLQIRWQAIPEERRRAFKEAMDSDEQTEIGGIQLKVNNHRVMDQYAPFDSALELKALPCLSELICQRWHPDLLEFLRESPFVDEVTLLNHGQRTLDLRGTSIRKLMLDMTGLQELWLGEETEQLRSLTQPQFLQPGHIQHQLSDAGAPQIKCPLTVVQQSQFIEEGISTQKLQQIRVPPLADKGGEARQRL